MGACFSVQFSCDQPIADIFRCLRDKGYIRSLKENLTALESEMEDLKAIQHEVQNKVAREEETLHRQRREPVKVWFTRVENVDTKIINLLRTSSDQIKKLCLYGLCSKNVCSSYKYGKSVFYLLEEVKKLKSEGSFEVVTEPAPRSKFEKRPTRPTIGQEKMLEKAWNRLMEDGVGIVGLHGMGGVGKTTLLEKLHNKFAEIGSKFDVVIWVVVSKGAKISKIQEDIAQKLHLCSDEWKNKNKSDKAADIHRVLEGKRFVLMLDDMWEKKDLKDIGVPFPTKESNCKVAFTTRSREVCGRMGDSDPMQVNCLEQEEAWKLFENKVFGDNPLTRDPAIVERARKVAEKCRGLPLALSLIGETMSSKTMVQEWEHAVDVLTRSAAEFEGMEDEILPVLKYSYDSLGDENIKSCFLYCALFPEDCRIIKEGLIEYWIGEGFIGEDQVLKRAMNEGYTKLGTLIRANLLMENDTKRVVMHDVVREMALWIASDFGKQKESFVVQAGVGLHKIPKVKDWGAVRRMSLMCNDIEEITCSSKCYQLTTLFLQSNHHLKNLSGEFIQSMQKLVVLDLSENLDFKVLPEQISELASLQFLDLSHTSIEQLPVGFQELKKLTHLNLAFTQRLRSISGISKLSSLRILKLLMSNVHGDVSLLKELQFLEYLQVLTKTISTELGLEKISVDQRLANCITELEIRTFQQKPFDISLLMSFENLNSLFLNGIHVSEVSMKCIETKKNYSSDLHIPTSPCFTNLYSLILKDCSGTKDLTWLLFAPNLVDLHVSSSKEVEEIINKEKTTNLTSITPFQKLERLGLDSLPELKSIYWSPLPFSFLKHLTVRRCPKLRKLPFNATSVPRVAREFTIKMDPLGQKTELEWEDEDTKNRFFPLITKSEF